MKNRKIIYSLGWRNWDNSYPKISIKSNRRRNNCKNWRKHLRRLESRKANTLSRMYSIQDKLNSPCFWRCTFSSGTISNHPSMLAPSRLNFYVRVNKELLWLRIGKSLGRMFNWNDWLISMRGTRRKINPLWWLG